MCFLCFLCSLCSLRFLCVWNLLVKKIIIKRFKIALIPSSTILLTCTPLTWLWKVICTHLFLFMVIICGVFSFYENFFLFMIICKNLFFLWESFLIYDDLWESLLVYDKLFYYLFFNTLTHLCVPILIFFYHSKSIFISKNWKSSWT